MGMIHHFHNKGLVFNLLQKADCIFIFFFLFSYDIHPYTLMVKAKVVQVQCYGVCLCTERLQNEGEYLSLLKVQSIVFFVLFHIHTIQVILHVCIWYSHQTVAIHLTGSQMEEFRGEKYSKRLKRRTKKVDWTSS